MGQPFLVVRRQRVLGRQFNGAWRQFGIGRDPRRLPPGERLFAQLVPAPVELALVPVDPFLRHVMRRKGGAGGEIKKKGLSGAAASGWRSQLMASLARSVVR